MGTWLPTTRASIRSTRARMGTHRTRRRYPTRDPMRPSTSLRTSRSTHRSTRHRPAARLRAPRTSARTERSTSTNRISTAADRADLALPVRVAPPLSIACPVFPASQDTALGLRRWLTVVTASSTMANRIATAEARTVSVAARRCTVWSTPIARLPRSASRHRAPRPRTESSEPSLAPTTISS